MLSAAVVILLATFLYLLISSAEFLSRRSPDSSKIPHRTSLQWLQSWQAAGDAAIPATTWRPQMHRPVRAPALRRSLGRPGPTHSCDRAPHLGERSTCRGTAPPGSLAHRSRYLLN